MSGEIVQGNNGNILSLTITDSGQIVNLTNAIINVSFKYKTTGFTKQATITDANNGICQVTLSVEDIQQIGVYTFQATVTFGDGREFSSEIEKFTVTKKQSFTPVIGGGTSDIGNSTTNGNIIVNGIEIKVYDDTQVRTDITNLKTTQHSHANKAALDRLNIDTQNKLTIDGVELITGGFVGSNVSNSSTNGNILINGTEVKVYDDTQIKQNLVKPSTNNGNILVDGTELNVYDDQTLQSDITNILNMDIIKRLGISVNGLITIDGIEQQLGGGNGDMTLVVKDYFEGSTDITKTYIDNMVGFSISNDAGVAGGTLTFTINGITIPVKATESFEANFLPFKTVTINSTVPYRATVSIPYGATFDTIAPLNITGLAATNITTSDLTLNWVASTSSDVAGYDVYQDSTLLTTVSGTTCSITGLTPLTSYSFTVKAKDNSENIASGVSINVSTLADTIAPSNVTNLVPSNIQATNLILSWTASTSTDTTGYQVFNGSTLLATVTGTTYNVTGLTTNTTYTFTVKSKDGYNNIASGTSVTITTANVDTTPPSDVTGLTAGTATVSSIPIGWTLSASSDVANYEIAYSSNGGTSYTIASSLVNSSSTSYTITGLTTGTTYTIRVVAIDTSGNRSTGVTITKATASNTTYVVSASPSSGTYNTTQNVTLSVAPSGATIYYTTNNTTPTTSSTVYNTPIVVSANTTIKFFAQDGTGNSTSIQTATYTIDTVAPTVTISPVAGTYNATQSVTISANETSTIYFTIDNTTPTTGSTVYSAPISVTATKTIKYLVVDTAGNQTTGTATYTIDTVSPDSVTSLTVGTVTSSSIPLTWTAPTATDVTKYEIAYSSDGGTNYIIATSSLSAPTTSYTLSGLAASTNYTVRVVAIDGAGNRSTPTNVTTTTSALVLTSVTNGLIHGYNFTTGSGTQTTLSDLTGTANLSLSGYLFDGTSGWTPSGLVSNNVGTWKVTDTTTIGITQGTNFTINLSFIYTDTYAGKSIYQTNNDNTSGINIGTNTNGRFGLGVAGNFNTKQPQLTVNTSSGNISTNLTTGETIVKNNMSVITLTYDATSKLVSWYVNGTLNDTYTSPVDLKFDGFVSGKGLFTHHKMTFYNRVLTTSEISTVNTELAS